MSETQENLKNTLRRLADGLETGNTFLEEKEMDFILGTLNRVCEPKLSKDQAARYLGLDNTKKLDYLVTSGKLPKGRKEVGFKEVFWYRSDLDKCLGGKSEP